MKAFKKEEKITRGKGEVGEMGKTGKLFPFLPVLHFSCVFELLVNKT